MRKLMVPLALIAALATAGAASAATSVGTIEAINTGQMTVTLTDGSVYQFAKTANLNNFMVGDQVSINWAHAGTEMDANAISPVN